MILGTAGHIDHGKTTLVRALTGVDTDRLPEEKKRGITIELGFAPLLLDGLDPIGVVDVPGHEAFVRTMLAGATGIDLALLVIAADEGVMPQTREHLTILELLGVNAGVVALTKSDLAEPDWIQLVEDDVRKLLASGSLAGAPIVRCSATTGAGIAELKATIATAARALPARAADDLFRMPIDRAFSVKGTGTVVTGTVWSGILRLEDQVVLLPRGTEARVRGLERHGKSVHELGVGARAAVALGGVDRADIEVRGAVVVRAGDGWVASKVLRADIALQAGAPTLGPRTRVRFHLGTADVGARVVAVGGPVASGARTAVRIMLDEPVVSRAGDRFVIRTSSPQATIGGGVITDPDPPKRRVKPWPASGVATTQHLEWLIHEGAGKGVSITALPIRLGLKPSAAAKQVKHAKSALRVGDILFEQSLAKSVESDALKLIDACHREHPLEPGLPIQSLRSAVRVAPALVDAVIEAVVARGAITSTGGYLARTGWTVGGGEADSAKTKAVLGEIVGAGANPPSVDELAARHGKDVIAVLKLLARRGDLVAVAADRYFSTGATLDLIQVVRVSLEGGAKLTASQLRETTGLTRKYLIPFLEYCDREGITSRAGDIRTLGNRLGAATPRK
jgi:selenocysteine-specific elongation factor